MNRRNFIKGLVAATAVATLPIKWVGEKIKGCYGIFEIRYYDRRCSNAELEAMSRGIFPDEQT